MPIYDLRCKKCGIEFEELCKLDDVITCLCGSTETEKLISGFAVTFTNPIGTSKMDSFGYRAGHNMEKAKAERRHAQKLDPKGGSVYKETKLPRTEI
jgi:putative FmdB family regulatory protein